ncbi:cytochrome P450 [Actinomadura rupiterrae]|uniref:cytochrome P450 n=1 Tax=Actinomadura rupiterrae TaxID=559627 RepID=UPI0020A44DC0|nr:cytochrome P450 [Actinomadura rupiterrae]MCP2342068.1 cytochrome P450 [Actinomadura rupiterrae]
MTEADEPLFNPFAPGYAEDPYPQFARLRAEAPVYEHPLGFWVLSRYEDVQALLRSEESVELVNLAAGPYRDMLQQLHGGVITPRMQGLSMLDRDDPDHLRLRKLVTKAFTPKAISGLQTWIDAMVEARLDEIAEAGGGDVVDALAYPIPFEVISKMLGMPEADHERIRELTGVIAGSVEPRIDPAVIRAIAEADEELSGIFRRVIEWKREHPSDDVLSGLIRAEDNGDVLSDDELVSQSVLMYIAGHHNTVNLISNGVLALLRHPGQLAALREDPDLLDNAVEEVLRYESPAHFTRRVTLNPYKVGDVEIPPGAFVMASYASANRDEEFFGPDAAQVRLDRKEARLHLSFAAGGRYCLGAALARMEGKAAIGGLVRRFEKLTADGDVEWNGRINLRGPKKLPIAV